MTMPQSVLAGGGGSRFVGDHKLVTSVSRPSSRRVGIERGLGKRRRRGHRRDRSRRSRRPRPRHARIVPIPRWHEGRPPRSPPESTPPKNRRPRRRRRGLADQPLIPIGAWRRVTECADSPIAVTRRRTTACGAIRTVRPSGWELLPAKVTRGARCAQVSSGPHHRGRLSRRPRRHRHPRRLINHENGAHNGHD